MRTKLDWLNEGFTILIEQGEKALTIENLISRLGVTKGSFYHHFKNRADFTKELISQWKVTSTDTVLEAMPWGAAPEELYEALEKTLAATFSPKLETAMRIWAADSKPISRSVQKVDQQRCDVLCRIILALGYPQEQAERLSRFIYSSFIGALFIHPAPKSREQKEWDALIWKILQENIELR